MDMPHIHPKEFNFGKQNINNQPRVVDHPPAIPMLVLFGLLLTIIILQFLVQTWKKKHPKSFNFVTLIFMWLFPGVVSLFSGFYRMLLLWILYTGVSAYLFYLATRKPLGETTPRKVYAWFFWVFNVAHITLILGVIIAVLRLLGIVSLISMVTPKFLVNLVNSKVGNWIFPHAHILIFYGLYFGILVRDCAEQCADRMANYFTYMRNKFYNSARREERSCGICGVQFEPEFLFDVESKPQPVVLDQKKKLECGHNFHDFCLRGWMIVGKKDVCPVCKEKVSLKEFLSKNPWDIDSNLWISFLDIVRYLIVWNPLIIIVLQVLLISLHPLLKMT